MKEEISNEELYNTISNVTDVIKGRHGIGSVCITYILGEPTKAILTTAYNRDALTFIIRSIVQKNDEYRAEIVKIKDIIEEALEE